MYNPVEERHLARGLAVVTRSAKKRAEQEVAVGEMSHEQRGKVADESSSPGSEEGIVANDIVTHDTPTEVMATPLPIEPQREVTSKEDVSGRK